MQENFIFYFKIVYRLMRANLQVFSVKARKNYRSPQNKASGRKINTTKVLHLKSIFSINVEKNTLSDYKSMPNSLKES